jgi:hypothetical protein
MWLWPCHADRRSIPGLIEPNPEAFPKRKFPLTCRPVEFYERVSLRLPVDVLSAAFVCLWFKRVFNRLVGFRVACWKLVKAVL